MRSVMGLGLILVVTGCGKIPFLEPRAPAAAPGVEAALEAPSEFETDLPGAEAPPPRESARTPEQFDTTTAEDRAAAAAPTAPTATETRLGTTIASLGDPASPGFWAETPLVDAPREGRLDYPASGKSVTVELRPSGGAAGSGTRVSLPALRVLEAPLTALPELVVIGL